MSNDNLFLKYQKKWLQDTSMVKIAAKSRRIGFTWTQAFEDVKDALTLKIRGKYVDVWYTSADLSAAKEYINYCKFWAKSTKTAFQDLGNIVIDEEKDIKALSLEFKNGARINAISSNPSAFRSKGGKVVIDEFAFHKNPAELWKAARPVITWGYPLRIISSLNGTNNLFYKFIQLIKKGKLKWSLQEIDIFKAVDDGLVDKIYDRPTTKEEKEAWLQELKESCGDEVTWQQEFCCIAVDEASAFISYELINSCIEDTLIIGSEGKNKYNIKTLSDIEDDIYIGYDIARKKDLSVITVWEKKGSVFYLRVIYELKNMLFRGQKAILYSLLKLPKCRKCCIDKTGIGAQLAEDAELDFGKKVEGITFSAKTKEELAYKLYYAFEDRNIRFPDDEDFKNDIHSIKRLPTSTGVVRFEAERSETDGHADRFWSSALGIFAGTNEPYIKPKILSAKPSVYSGLNSELNLRRLGGLLRGWYLQTENCLQSICKIKFKTS